jgi:hypothetical protein
VFQNKVLRGISGIKRKLKENGEIMHHLRNSKVIAVFG